MRAARCASPSTVRKTGGRLRATSSPRASARPCSTSPSARRHVRDRRDAQGKRLQAVDHLAQLLRRPRGALRAGAGFRRGPARRATSSTTATIAASSCSSTAGTTVTASSSRLSSGGTAMPATGRPTRCSGLLPNAVRCRPRACRSDRVTSAIPRYHVSTWRIASFRGNAVSRSLWGRSGQRTAHQELNSWRERD